MATSHDSSREMNRITEICDELWGDRRDYYLRWYHSKPLVITGQRREELVRLHSILYKACEYLALNYRDYTDTYLQLSPKELEILDYQSKKTFHAGAWRPDWIVSAQGEILLCEITSRFFGHGLFMSYYSECDAARFHTENSRYEELMQHVISLPGSKNEIFVLKSADKTSAIAMYKPLYERFGKKVTILEADEVESNRSAWEGKCVISALNQHDMMSYSMDTLKALVDSEMINDMRTILLLHDKRFMRLWFEDSFTERFLTKEETDFLRSHAIMTYLPCDTEAFADARAHKDKYILKPYMLGKSEGVYAGCMTSEKEWAELWEHKDMDSFILQPFIDQRTYPQDWEGQHFDEYICGMMLCIDDKYYDSGMVRASSAPVTNKVDDRKMCVVHSSDKNIIERGHLL